MTKTTAKSILAIFFLAIAVTLWWATHRAHAIASGSCGGCNVLLITIDTLRVDRVGAFGSSRQLTPQLDRLAHDAIRFTRAYASAPLTLPSHTSIFTAVSPPVHGVRANGIFRLADTLPTLATVLHDRGYRTGAFVGAFVLDARFGLTRGFDVYDDQYGEKREGDATEGAERRAEDVITPAARWILNPAPAVTPARAGAPWFAWVHLYDPHAPYRAPAPYASQHEPYDAEVAYTDAMVGQLLETLRRDHQLDRTLVVVTADHGESLGEHGERTHGVFVYDVTMRVPWFIWTGDSDAARSFDGLARLIDLAPTTLDLLGLPAPATFEGRTLLPALNGRAAAPTTAYIEAMDASLTRNWAPLTGIVAGGAKLIDLPMPELYDLDRDPGEATNIFAREGAQARTLTALLRDTSAGFAARGTHSETTTLNADARQRLQALGYVGSSADPAHRVYTANDDPKVLIGPANDLDDAVKRFNGGARTEAMAQVRDIARDHPQFSTAFGQLAAMKRQTGDLHGAIATLEDIVKRGIADYRVMIVLGGYLTEAGNPDKAATLLEAVTAAHPDSFDAYNSLGAVMMREGRHARARDAFAKAIAIDPTSAVAFANLGSDELATREFRSGIEHLQRAVELDSRQFDALYNLGLALYESGRRDEARPYLQQFVNSAPPAKYAADIEHIRALLRQTS